MKGKNKYVCFGIAAIPAVLCLIFICYFGANLIFWDEWVMVDLAMKIQDSGWSFADLFAQHNEHRIFFPRLFYLGIAYLTGFNSVAQMIASFVMLSLIAFIVVNYLISRKGVSDRKKYIFIAIASFFIYNWEQSNNLLWGFQVGFLMALLFSVVSFYFLSLMFMAENGRKKRFYLAIALSASLIASFSSGQGLLSWIVGVILFFIVRRKKLYPYFIVWIAFALFAWTAYYYDYVRFDSYSGIYSFFRNPMPVLAYFFALLGNTIGAKPMDYLLNVAGISICLFVSITGIILWKDKKSLQSHIFPVSLIVNALLVAAAIAMGRIETEGTGSVSLSSRYTSFTIYIITGLLMIWMELNDKKYQTRIKYLTNIFLGVLIFSLPVTMGKGFYQGVCHKERLAYASYIVETAKIHPEDNLNGLYSQVMIAEVPQMNDFLKTYRHNVFRKPAYEVPPALYQDSLGIVSHEILQINTNSILLMSDRIQVSALKITPAYQHIITHLYLDVDGTVYPLYYDKQKPNPLIQWLKQYDKARKGVLETSVSSISFQSLTPGIHHARIKALTKCGSYYIIDTGIVFESK